MLNQIINPTESVNCFTGCITRVVCRDRGDAFREADILSFGNGYQMRCGYDEYGFPEIIFDVLKTSVDALNQLGGRCIKEYVYQDERWFDQIMKAMADRGHVIVWLNSSFLEYSETFYRRPPYLHAILLESYDEETESFAIFDSLVFDHGRKSINARVARQTLEKALQNPISGNELAPELGTFYTVVSPQIDAVTLDISRQVLRQARENVNNPLHSTVVRDYRALVLASLANDKADRKHAARRLFDHINTLFIIPSSVNLRKDLALGGFSPEIQADAEELEKRWKHLAVMALKFEVTLSANLLPRIEAKFDEIEQLHTVFWNKLSLLEADVMVTQRTTNTFTIEASDVERWADYSGDRNPVHFDPKAALAFGVPFPFAHGMLSIIPVKTLIDKKAGSTPFTVDFRFARPLKVGGTMRVNLDNGESTGIEVTDVAGGAPLIYGIASSGIGQANLDAIETASVFSGNKLRPSFVLNENYARGEHLPVWVQLEAAVFSEFIHSGMLEQAITKHMTIVDDSNPRDAYTLLHTRNTTSVMTHLAELPDVVRLAATTPSLAPVKGGYSISFALSTEAGGQLITLSKATLMLRLNKKD